MRQTLREQILSALCFLGALFAPLGGAFADEPKPVSEPRSAATEAPAEEPTALGFPALPEAEKHYRAAVELLENPKGLTPAGEQAVRKEFEAGLTLEPDNLDAQILFVRVLLRLQAEPEALSNLDALVKNHPEEKSLRRARGLISVTEAPRWDMAEEDFAWLSGQEGSDSQVWTGLGFARFQQGKLVGAREAFKKALALDSANLEARNNLGWVEFKDNHFDDAEKAFSDVVSRDPKYVGSHFGLAKIYEEKGELGKAIDQYNVLLDLTPNFVYFLDLLLLYFRHYQLLFFGLLAIVAGLFIRTWIKVARRDQEREAQAGQFRK